MLTFIADETEITARDTECHGLTVYGGLIVDEPTFLRLTRFLYRLKERYFLPQNLELKWRFESVFQKMRHIGHVAPEKTKNNDPALYNGLKTEHEVVKEEILGEVGSSAAKILIVIRPNGPLKASQEKNVLFSLDSVAKKFEKILREKGETGVILADEMMRRFPGHLTDYEYVVELNSKGSRGIPFEKLIAIFPSVSSDASAAHQMNDIVLGAIQYYLLTFLRKEMGRVQNHTVSKSLVAKLAANFIRSNSGGYVINNGILTHPARGTRVASRAGALMDRLEDQLKADFDFR